MHFGHINKRPSLLVIVVTTVAFFQTPPVAEEMGHCDSVSLSEVGDTQVVVFKHGRWGGRRCLQHGSSGSSLLPKCLHLIHRKGGRGHLHHRAPRLH